MIADRKIESTPPADETRFAFGENWQRFLTLLNEERITEAVRSLQNMTGLENFEGKTFLDIGSGSGLFSLAARRLGAKVTSFDYDPQSVACTAELKRRYEDAEQNWRIEQGSALDKNYLGNLGRFDIVYSWGVLHHTGNMWNALENITANVKPGGLLFISLYNEEGWRSTFSKNLKLIYNKAPEPMQFAMACAYTAFEMTKGFTIDVLRLKNPLTRYRDRSGSRGMAVWYDSVDWLGGYPFEVARPGDVFDFYHARGFELIKLNTVPRGHGCNEFVFRRK